jgi:hypothetical protein
MSDDLVLPVPEVLSATYFVPLSPTDPAAIVDQTASALREHVPGPLGAAAGKMLEAGVVSAGAVPSSAVPPVPEALQRHLGVAEELVRTVGSADSFAAFVVSWPPGWPPVHEAVARACAGAFAAETGMPLVDGFTPLVVAPERALGSLPDAEYQIRLADWVEVSGSPGNVGLWVTTKGLGRFGLPELQALNVPPQHGGPWSRVMLGLASRLLDLWLDALRARNGAAFARVPAEVEIGGDDIAAADGSGTAGGGRVRVRLAFDPASGDHADSFLTVQPPDDHPGSAGEFMSGVCAELFGVREPEVRYIPATQAMRRAVEAARESLPGTRARFLADGLPPGGRLMVKYEIPGDDGSEYPWVYVTSWKDGDKVLGSSADDVLRDRTVRAGRPVVIDAAAIVDWAVWIDGQGIVEGGQTNEIAIRQGMRQNPDGE